MVEVRFASVIGVEAGIKCTLDGAVKYTDEAGLCSFFGVSQGAHSYSITAPEGWSFVSGEDVWGRPLYESGTTVIEWVELPGTPWPETSPWMMKMVFEEEAPPEEPPEEPPVVSETLGKAGSVLATLGLVGIFVDSARRR